MLLQASRDCSTINVSILAELLVAGDLILQLLVAGDLSLQLLVAGDLSLHLPVTGNLSLHLRVAGDPSLQLRVLEFDFIYSQWLGLCSWCYFWIFCFI